MLIDLSTIEHVPRHFDLLLEPNWWQEDVEDGPILGFDGTSECHLDISKAGSRYILDGSLSACVLVACDRCLEPFRNELDFDFKLFLAFHLSGSDQSELELSEDDLWVQLVEGSEVDLKEIVREQIYLSLPMKSLCREDCSGLCPSCGINLNKQGCTCQRGEGHTGFSKLKALKLET